MAEPLQPTGARAKAVAIATGAAAAHRRVRLRWPDWWASTVGWLGASLALEIDRRRLFLWLPVAFGAGIIAYFNAELEPALAASAVPFAVALALAVAGRQRLAVMGLWLAVAAFFGGFLLASLRARVVASPVLASPVFAKVDGHVETIDRTIFGGRMVVRLVDMAPPVERMPERVRITFRGASPLISGDAVRFRARLTPPQPAAVPGGFDFQREAFFQRLGAVGYAAGDVTRITLSVSPPLRVRMVAAIDRARNALTDRIISVIGGSTGAIAAALITGKRGQIAEADNENWRAAGIYHLISISGLHMMLAAGLFFWGARIAFSLWPGVALRHPTKKWAALVAMAGAIAYDIFSGSEVATERSLIMTLVMFGAILVDRPALAMRNLAISGLLIMALRPETVLGPSFQMSFSAVAGLVAYAEIERLWHERRSHATLLAGPGFLARTLRLALAFALTSLIAGLATAPFQAYHFHRLNPYGILGNALSVPICSFIVMPAALVGVLLSPLGLDAPAWWVMGQGIAYIQVFATLVADIDGAVMMVARFSAGALVMLSLGLLLATLMTTLPFRLAGAAIGVIGLSMTLDRAAPDLIIDPSGKVAMVRTETGGLSLLGRQKPAFAVQQWLSGDRDSRSPKDATLAAGISCDRLGCTASLVDGRSVALVLDRAAFAEDCERAAIVITPLRAPEACREGAEVYDRDFLTDYGATYITRDGRHETARNARIDRPWAPRRGSIQSDPATTPTSAPLTAPAWSPEAPDPIPGGEDQ